MPMIGRGRRRPARSPRRGATLLALALCGAAVTSGAVWIVTGTSAGRVRLLPERHPERSWAACSARAQRGGASTFHPRSDGRARALVTHQPENRADNARAYSVDGRRYPSVNTYVPSTAELRAFRTSRTSAGQPVRAFNPYFRYVDGRPGLRHPSTDDLIQWAAHKWGIPEDWLRAQYMRESFWNAFQLGDRNLVSPSWYSRYPRQARIPGGHDVYQSLGITQVKWVPDGSVGPGSEPLRWKSSAFNVDFQAAMVRFYFDNPNGARSAWGDGSYAPCQRWNSIGGWFEPYPWGNPGQQDYVHLVQQHLSGRDWTAASFVEWRPSALPPGIRLR
jgi:hypothetical protein